MFEISFEKKSREMTRQIHINVITKGYWKVHLTTCCAIRSSDGALFVRFTKLQPNENGGNRRVIAASQTSNRSAIKTKSVKHGRSAEASVQETRTRIRRDRSQAGRSTEAAVGGKTVKVRRVRCESERSACAAVREDPQLPQSGGED